MTAKAAQWLWLDHTVVLIASSREQAKAEYDRLMAEWPTNTLRESTSGYDSDGKTYRVIFWRAA